MQNRGMLITLRAAAIVIIVTGLNDVIASAVPRYEPLYLYLAAIALVALTDGILLGIAAAVLSTAFYALLFMPRPQALSTAILTPAAAALGVAVTGAVIRGFVRGRRRKAEPVYAVTPPLLETSAVARVTENAEVLQAIDELRNELRASIGELSASRGREGELAERTRSHSAEIAAMELRIRQFEKDRDWALKVAEEARKRAEHEDVLRADAERLLAEAREESATMAGRLAELELSLRESEAVQRDAEELSHLLTETRTLQRQAAAALAEERATRQKLEEEVGAFDKKLQTIVTHLASDHETDLGQALSDKEEARAEARAASMKLRDAETLLAETRAAAQTEIDRLRALIATHEAPRATRPRVMIVHPDAELRATAAASLERAGYEVVSAGDGLEALRVAIAKQPDIVIAETSMPKMDGRELCQLLKSQEKTAHIRVVLLMRASDEEPRGDLQPDEILRKPVPVETLKATLANLLSSSRA